MGRIERWLRALTQHVTAHWLVHLAGGVAVMFAMMLFGFGLLALYLLLLGSVLIAAALELEALAAGAFFGIAALGSFLVLCAHCAAFALWLGWVRVALMRERGQGADWPEILWALRHPLRTAGFAMFAGFLVFSSAALFYLPLVFLGPWLLMAAVALAGGEVGLFAALGQGWRRCGQAYGELLLVSLVFGVFALFMYFFPLLGPGMAAALVTASAVAIHESLAREGASGR